MKIAFIGQPHQINLMLSESIAKKYAVGIFSDICDEKSQRDEWVSYKPDITFFLEIPKDINQVSALSDGLKVLWTDVVIPRPSNGTIIFSEKTVGNLQALGTCANVFDYIIHTDVSNAAYLESIGCYLSAFQQYPLDLEKFSFLSKPQPEKVWGLLFVGADSENRLKCFGALKRDYQFLHAASGLDGIALIPYIEKTKCYAHAFYEKVPHFSTEMMMAMAAGVPVLSEKLPLEGGLLPDRHYVLVKEAGDYYRIARLHIEENSEYLTKIKENALIYVNEFLSVNRVLPQLINKIQTNQLEKTVIGHKFFERKIKALLTCLQYDGFEHLLMDANNAV